MMATRFQAGATGRFDDCYVCEVGHGLGPCWRGKRQ